MISLCMHVRSEYSQFYLFCVCAIRKVLKIGNSTEPRVLIIMDGCLKTAPTGLQLGGNIDLSDL